jgi:hypothetical protein
MTLNVTLQFTAPSSYQVTGVNATGLPSQSRQISYSTPQQKLIAYALSSPAFTDNQTIQDTISGGSFYVESVSVVNPSNTSPSIIYTMFLRQIDGGQTVIISTNGDLSQVLFTGIIGETDGGVVPSLVGLKLVCPLATSGDQGLELDR